MNPLHIFETPQLLTRAAADGFLAAAAAAIAARGRFSVALAGGSTPRALYALLAAENLDWQAIHFFWGDERCLPPDHPESNYRMAAESLLTKIPLPPENIHRIMGELSPQLAAEKYQRNLRVFWGGAPRFDLVLLGMGEDGHTASLFPGSPALAETLRWVTALEHAAPPPPLVSRVTLTLGAINAARQVIFLVSGAGKAKRLAEIWRGGSQLPAGRVQPLDGDLLWLVDQSAASLC